MKKESKLFGKTKDGVRFITYLNSSKYVKITDAIELYKKGIDLEVNDGKDITIKSNF